MLRMIVRSDRIVNELGDEDHDGGIHCTMFRATENWLSQLKGLLASWIMTASPKLLPADLPFDAVLLTIFLLQLGQVGIE